MGWKEGCLLQHPTALEMESSHWQNRTKGPKTQLGAEPSGGLRSGQWVLLGCLWVLAECWALPASVCLLSWAVCSELSGEVSSACQAALWLLGGCATWTETKESSVV